jgi:hypothetical protein
MNREDFAAFVARTLDDVIHLAEEKCGKELPRKIAFRWLASSHPIVSESIVDHIVERVFVDEEHGGGRYPGGRYTSDCWQRGWSRTSAIWAELDGSGWAIRSHCGEAFAGQDGRQEIQMVA